MTHIVDLLDLDHLEAGLRKGTLPTKEKFYAEVTRQLGRKIEKLEMDAMRNSMFPEERRILTSLPYKEQDIHFDPELIQHRLGTTCANGIHKLDQPGDFSFRKGRAICRRCELARGAESKRRARARARAENPPKPRARKPRAKQPKRVPKDRVELTLKQVLEIRADYENNNAYGWAAATARKYDMSVEAIRAIAKRRTWKDV